MHKRMRLFAYWPHVADKGKIEGPRKGRRNWFACTENAPWSRRQWLSFAGKNTYVVKHCIWIRADDAYPVGDI